MTKPRTTKRGRPRLLADAVYVAADMPATMREALRAKAQAEGVAVAEIVRRAVRQYLGI